MIRLNKIPIFVIVGIDGDLIIQIKYWLELYVINELHQFYFSIFFLRLWIKERQFFFTTSLKCLPEYRKSYRLGIFQMVVRNYVE